MTQIPFLLRNLDGESVARRFLLYAKIVKGGFICFALGLGLLILGYSMLPYPDSSLIGFLLLIIGLSLSPTGFSVSFIALLLRENLTIRWAKKQKSKMEMKLR
jgi:ABC-type multidrug transport system permease subunit